MLGPVSKPFLSTHFGLEEHVVDFYPRVSIKRIGNKRAKCLRFEYKKGKYLSYTVQYIMRQIQYM